MKTIRCMHTTYYYIVPTFCGGQSWLNSFKIWLESYHIVRHNGYIIHNIQINITLFTWHLHNTFL